MIEQVQSRASGTCEWCSGTEGLRVVDVPPNPHAAPDRAFQACAACQNAMEAPEDTPHLRCLSEAVWSEVPGVQVSAWRMMHRLETQWAQDLLEQVWMDEEQLAWAEQGLIDPDAPKTVDSNGTQLQDGDNVTLIKDLDVKGANFMAKRGTLVKGIRLNDDPGLVEGRVNRTSIFLKTEFLKKA